MMKIYASHYLFIEDKGYFKQAAVGLTEGGRIEKITFICKETENTEWLPGIIILIPKVEKFLSKEIIETCKRYIEKSTQPITHSAFNDIDKQKEYMAVYFSSFNFIKMRIVDETQHKLLP